MGSLLDPLGLRDFAQREVLRLATGGSRCSLSLAVDPDKLHNSTLHAVVTVLRSRLALDPQSAVLLQLREKKMPSWRQSRLWDASQLLPSMIWPTALVCLVAIFRLVDGCKSIAVVPG